jgi:hypothetical protein
MAVRLGSVSAERDANLLSVAARRNLQHPFAYAPARTVTLAAIARPARPGADLVVQHFLRVRSSEIFL